MNNIEDIKNSLNRIETIMNNEICEFNKPIIEGNLNLTKRYIENLIKENKELKEEKVLNEKILYFANNTLCNYHEGYQAGLHKETTAIEIVAEERERFIIAQEIERLKNTINELHNKLDEGNKRVKDNYIPKSKVKEDLERCKKVYEEEMKPYQTEYGLNVTGLSKKEKEQLVNKRNCLITQMKTYEMLLED